MELLNTIMPVVISLVVLLSFVGGYMLRYETEKSKPAITLLPPDYQPKTTNPEGTRKEPVKKVDLSNPYISQAREEAFERRMKDFKHSDLYVPLTPQPDRKKVKTNG